MAEALLSPYEFRLAGRARILIQRARLFEFNMQCCLGRMTVDAEQHLYEGVPGQGRERRRGIPLVGRGKRIALAHPHGDIRPR